MAQKTKRAVTLLEALIPVFITIGILMYTALPVFGVNGEVHIPLILGGLAAAIMAMRRLSYTWAEIEEGIISTISSTMQAIIILAIIGMIIDTWILGGIVSKLKNSIREVLLQETFPDAWRMMVHLLHHLFLGIPAVQQ